MLSDLERLFELELTHCNSSYIRTFYNQFISFYTHNNHHKDVLPKREYICDLGHTLDDIFPINAYTSSIGNEFIPRTINCSIRSEATGPFENHLIALLDQSLKLLEPYNNETVFRMVDRAYIGNLANQLDSFRKSIGKTFLIKHFLSTSKVSWSHPITWQIKTLPLDSKARYIEYISAKGLGNEEEVLFQRNSKFKIMDVKKCSDHHLILLQEMPHSSESTLIYVDSLEVRL